MISKIKLVRVVKIAPTDVMAAVIVSAWTHFTIMTFQFVKNISNESSVSVQLIVITMKIALRTVTLSFIGPYRRVRAWNTAR